MNPITIISIAKSCAEALPLAAKAAQSQADWRHINQTAANILTALRSIESDDTRTSDLRDVARELCAAMRIILRDSYEHIQMPVAA